MSQELCGMPRGSILRSRRLVFPCLTCRQGCYDLHCLCLGIRVNGILAGKIHQGACEALLHYGDTGKSLGENGTWFIHPWCHASLLKCTGQNGEPISQTPVREVTLSQNTEVAEKAAAGSSGKHRLHELASLSTVTTSSETPLLQSRAS